MEQSMRYIYQIYKDGSFSKAAEHLYMTQPAISIAVKRVESALGVEIFDRSRHPLELTEAGRVYIETVRRIQNTEDELAAQIEDLRNLQTGMLHIGGTHYLNSYILAPILAEFSQVHPGIQLQVTENSSAGLADALRQNAPDVILSCDQELIRQYQHRLAFCDHILLALHHSIPLPSSQTDLSLSAADILSGRHTSPDCPCIPLEQFRELQFILLQPGNNLFERSQRMFADAGFEPKVKMTLAQLVTAYHFAENGLGATFVSDRLVNSPTSNLSFFKIDSPQAKRLFYFLLPDRNYTAFAVRTFVELAAQRLMKNQKTE